jgi:hypothetical protein
VASACACAVAAMKAISAIGWVAFAAQHFGCYSHRNKIVRSQDRYQMPKPDTAPYGSWRSPITSDLIVAQITMLSDVRVDGDNTVSISD